MNRTGVNHRVLGGGQQYIEVLLGRNETIFVSSRALLYLDDGITLASDSCDSMGLVAATNQAVKPQRLALGKSAVGQILNISLEAAGSRLLCRPDAVLALDGEISTRPAAESFTRLSGDGTVFAFAKGTTVEHQLAGNQLRLEPASVVAMETSVEHHNRPDGRPLSLTVGGHGRLWAQTST